MGAGNDEGTNAVIIAGVIYVREGSKVTALSDYYRDEACRLC